MGRRFVWVLAWLAFRGEGHSQPLFYRVMAGDTVVVYAPIPHQGALFYERTFCIRPGDFFGLNPELLRQWDTVAWQQANPFTAGMTIDSALRKYAPWARRWTIRYFRAMPQQARIRIPWDTLKRCSSVPDSLRPRYEVRPGDTWYSLSRRWGIPLDTLRRWNPAAGDVLPVKAKLWRIGPWSERRTDSGMAVRDTLLSHRPVITWTNVRFADTLWVRASWLSAPDPVADDPLVLFYGGLPRHREVYVRSLNTGRMVRLRVVAPPPSDAGFEALIPGNVAAWLGEDRPRFRLMILVPAPDDR